MIAERTFVEEVEHAALKAGFARNAELFRRSCEVLSEKILQPTIVKVGANDGVTHDPCAEAVLSHDNWRGVLIEPVPYCFERLKANYPGPRFVLENIAIGREPGERPFYFINAEARKAFPRLPDWVEMIGSFDRDFIVRQIGKPHIVGAAGSLVDYIDECRVKVDTLENVIARHGLIDITVLHIDCEGHDYEVLKSIGATPMPMNLYIEHKHLNFGDKTALFATLHRGGMRLLDCGSDVFAFHPGRWLGTCKENYADLMRYSR